MTITGFGKFEDEAEIAFWTGVLGMHPQLRPRIHSYLQTVSTFFLTQFLTSLLWVGHSLYWWRSSDLYCVQGDGG